MYKTEKETMIEEIKGRTPCADKLIEALWGKGAFRGEDIENCIKIANFHHEKMGNWDIDDYIKKLKTGRNIIK